MTDTIIKPMQGLAAYLRAEARSCVIGKDNRATLMEWASEVEAALAAPQPVQEPVAVVDSGAAGGVGWTECGKDLVDGQELYAAPVQPVQPAADQKTLMDVTIDDDEALKFLRDMVAPPLLDGELTPVRMLLGDGHSGYGLYVAAAEYQDQGSWLLASVDAPVAQPVTDDPEFDGTDGAHPAWWRGHFSSCDTFCRLVNAILDGKDDGSGGNHEPWGATRKRLLDLAEKFLATGGVDYSRGFSDGMREAEAQPVQEPAELAEITAYIVKIARWAGGKIEIERQRGMGYNFAEFDALVAMRPLTLYWIKAHGLWGDIPLVAPKIPDDLPAQPVQPAPTGEQTCKMCGYVGCDTDAVGECPRCHWDELVPTVGNGLRSALNAMLTQFGMDEDEWNKPTFDQARAALATPVQPVQEPVAIPPFDCWSTNDGDSWFDHPADAQIIYDLLGNTPKVGDEFELTAGWRSTTARYRITEITGDGEGVEVEVECVSHPNAAPVQPVQPAPLTFGEIESCFPEGSYTTEEGFINVSAQWLHDFARAIEAAVRTGGAG